MSIFTMSSEDGSGEREEALVSSSIVNTGPLPCLACSNLGSRPLIDSGVVSPFSGASIQVKRDLVHYPFYFEFYPIRQAVERPIRLTAIKEGLKKLRSVPYNEMPYTIINYTIRNCDPLGESVVVNHPGRTKELVKYYTLVDSYKKEASDKGFNHVAFKNFEGDDLIRETVRTSKGLLPGDFCYVNDRGREKYPSWVGKTVKVIGSSIPHSRLSYYFDVEDVHNPKKHRRIHYSCLTLAPGQVYNPSTGEALEDL